MSRQYSTAVRNAKQTAIETTIGTAPKLQIRTGAPPATPATADSGTLLVEISLPSDWASQAAGVTTKLGTWTNNAVAAGTAGHYRIKDTAGTTTHEQGTVQQSTPLTTNALTAANSAVLNFAATTGVVVGMTVSGTGIPAGATVVATTGTTVTLDRVSAAGVANATAITFGGDMTLDNTSIANGQAVTISGYTITEGGA